MIPVVEVRTEPYSRSYKYRVIDKWKTEMKKEHRGFRMAQTHNRLVDDSPLRDTGSTLGRSMAEFKPFKKFHREKKGLMMYTFCVPILF
jgi:hypothetical protein